LIRLKRQDWEGKIDKIEKARLRRLRKKIDKIEKARLGRQD